MLVYLCVKDLRHSCTARAANVYDAVAGALELQDLEIDEPGHT